MQQCVPFSSVVEMETFCDVYTLWAVLTVWCNFTQREHFYGYSVSPATVKYTYVLVSAQYFYAILTKFWFY
jgi:hypothetical protein